MGQMWDPNLEWNWNVFFVFDDLLISIFEPFTSNKKKQIPKRHWGPQGGPQADRYRWSYGALLNGRK